MLKLCGTSHSSAILGSNSPQSKNGKDISLWITPFIPRERPNVKHAIASYLRLPQPAPGCRLVLLYHAIQHETDGTEMLTGVVFLRFRAFDVDYSYVPVVRALISTVVVFLWFRAQLSTTVVFLWFRALMLTTVMFLWFRALISTALMFISCGLEHSCRL